MKRLQHLILLVLPLLVGTSWSAVAESLERPDKDVVIPYTIDSLYYEGHFAGCEIRVPITIGGKLEHVILDNGCAQYCVASESFAREHGIQPIGTQGKAIGVTETVSMWLGVCDSLSVGELVLRDIIFVVLPDQSIDNSILHINAMLGGSFFRMAGEMVLDNENRTITFPTCSQPHEPNVTMDEGGVHFLKVAIEGDTLPFQLDLGAARTSLSVNYFNTHKKAIKHHWRVHDSHVGGVGGLKKVKVYTTPELALSACGGTYIKKDIEVSTHKKPNESNEFGAIGNDFILFFRKVIINLDQMYLIVEK